MRVCRCLCPVAWATALMTRLALRWSMPGRVSWRLTGADRCKPLPLLDALFGAPSAASPFWWADPASDGITLGICLVRRLLNPGGQVGDCGLRRSEEHTSELQSPVHL